MQFGRYYEEFEVGAVYKHWPGKTVTEYDDHLFCLITMNHHPLHLDANYAEKTTDFGKNVVVGNYIYSLLLGMSVPDVSGKAIANLEIESLRHVAPTFHGDTIYGETTVLDKTPSKSKSDRGIVYVETIGYKQDGTVVCIFRRKVMVPTKEYIDARGGEQPGRPGSRRRAAEPVSPAAAPHAGERRRRARARVRAGQLGAGHPARVGRVVAGGELAADHAAHVVVDDVAPAGRRGALDPAGVAHHHHRAGRSPRPPRARTPAAGGSPGRHRPPGTDQQPADGGLRAPDQRNRRASSRTRPPAHGCTSRITSLLVTARHPGIAGPCGMNVPRCAVPARPSRVNEEARRWSRSPSRASSVVFLVFYIMTSPDQAATIGTRAPGTWSHTSRTASANFLDKLAS